MGPADKDDVRHVARSRPHKRGALALNHQRCSHTHTRLTSPHTLQASCTQTLNCPTSNVSSSAHLVRVRVHGRPAKPGHAARARGPAAARVGARRALPAEALRHPDEPQTGTMLAMPGATLNAPYARWRQALLECMTQNMCCLRQAGCRTVLGYGIWCAPARWEPGTGCSPPGGRPALQQG